MSETPEPYRASACSVEGVERAPLTDAQLREAFEIEGGQDSELPSEIVSLAQPAPPAANPGNVSPDPISTDCGQKSGQCENGAVLHSGRRTVYRHFPENDWVICEGNTIVARFGPGEAGEREAKDALRARAEIARMTARETEANALLEQCREVLYVYWESGQGTDADRALITEIDRLLGLESVGEGDS